MDKKRYFDKNIYKVGFLDIETHGAGYNANQCFLISYYLKVWDMKKCETKDYKKVIDKKTLKYWNKKMLNNKKLQLLRPYDTELLKALVIQMKKCDMIIGHYSDYFDVPLVRTRCFMLRIPFIKYTDKIRFGDTWKRARFGMSFIRNSLDNLGITFGFAIRKTRFDIFIWRLAGDYGNKKALKKVLDHNKKDVEITRKVWKLCESAFSIPAKY